MSDADRLIAIRQVISDWLSGFLADDECINKIVIWLEAR